MKLLILIGLTLLSGCLNTDNPLHEVGYDPCLKRVTLDYPINGTCRLLDTNMTVYFPNPHSSFHLRFECCGKSNDSWTVSSVTRDSDSSQIPKYIIDGNVARKLVLCESPNIEDVDWGIAKQICNLKLSEHGND